VAIWEKVGASPYCVQFYEVFQGPALCFITMEKCACSFVQKLMSMPEIGEEAIAVAAGQMLHGMVHIHDRRIVHRDIKPENFLYGSDDNVKICDFGLSTMLPAAGLLGRGGGSCGTPPYMSPEMIKGTGHDQSTDMWSLGVTLYLLMFGDFPYVPAQKNGPAMKEAIRRGAPPKYTPANKTDKRPCAESVKFVRALLNRSASDRLTAHQAAEHFFIASREEPLYTSEDPGSDEKASVLRRLKVAHQGTREFEDRIDPTLQNDLTTLLAKLQERGGLKKSFSGDLEEACAKSESKLTEFSRTISIRSISKDSDGIGTPTSRRQSKSATHTGSVSLSPDFLKSLDKADADQSTAAPSDDNSNDSASRQPESVDHCRSLPARV